MKHLPDPPVPADANLTHFDDMPLVVRRLRDSGIAGVADAEVFRCAVLLWCAAWHQLPAGSLPNDDAELCRMVGLGRDLVTWGRIRAGVMRGWRLFSDGRLYHRVVSEKALEGWNRTRVKLWGMACDRLRKENKAREADKREKLPLPTRPDDIPMVWPEDIHEHSTGNTISEPETSADIPSENGLNRMECNVMEPIVLAAASSPASTRGKRRRNSGGKPEDAPVDPPQEAAAAEPIPEIDFGKPEPVVIDQPREEISDDVRAAIIAANAASPDDLIPIADLNLAADPALDAPHGYEEDGVTPIRSTPMPKDDFMPMPAVMPKAPPPPPPPHQIADVSEEAKAFNSYNQLASLQGWPQAMIMNSTTRFRMAARLAEVGGLPGWTQALIKATGAKFLQMPDGKPQRWFNLDFLLDEEKFRKLMEGRYDERHATAGQPTTGSTLAALARLGQEDAG